MRRLLVAATLLIAGGTSFAQQPPAQPPAQRPAQQPTAPPPAAQPSATPTAPAAPPGNYANPASWLCLPGREDACARPVPTADLLPAGYGPVTRNTPAANAPIDCFYVYPTISRDAGLNSDMTAGPEELTVTVVQFARFSSICRPYAPIYRQGTMASIAAALGGRDPQPVFDLAYGDVLNAWRHYLQHYNQGRPFVLIGHSQGTIHLIRLIASELEGRPEAARMLSALLIGYNVEVPEGQVVGGSFRRTPLCTSRGQTGCIVTYVSFRAEAAPPAGALFGRAPAAGRTIACTNPAALGSSDATPLDSYWFSAGQAAGEGFAWSTAGAPPAPFLHTRNLVSGACVNHGQLGYFALSVNADPRDARTDRIPGDVQFGGRIQPGWGMHLIDVNVAQGDLINVVRAQAEAFRAARR